MDLRLTLSLLSSIVVIWQGKLVTQGPTCSMPITKLNMIVTIDDLLNEEAYLSLVILFMRVESGSFPKKHNSICL